MKLRDFNIIGGLILAENKWFSSLISKK